MGTRIQLGVESVQIGEKTASFLISANPYSKKISIGLALDGEWLPEKDLVVWE